MEQYKTFHVVVETSEGQVCKDVYACSLFHAIDLLYYRDGMYKLQEDRTKYKLKNK